MENLFGIPGNTLNIGAAEQAIQQPKLTTSNFNISAISFHKYMLLCFVSIFIFNCSESNLTEERKKRDLAKLNSVNDDRGWHRDKWWARAETRGKNVRANFYNDEVVACSFPGDSDEKPEVRRGLRRMRVEECSTREKGITRTNPTRTPRGLFRWAWLPVLLPERTLTVSSWLSGGLHCWSTSGYHF